VCVHVHTREDLLQRRLASKGVGRVLVISVAGMAASMRGIPMFEREEKEWSLTNIGAGIDQIARTNVF